MHALSDMQRGTKRMVRALARRVSDAAQACMHGDRNRERRPRISFIARYEAVADMQRVMHTYRRCGRLLTLTMAFLRGTPYRCCEQHRHGHHHETAAQLARDIVDTLDEHWPAGCAVPWGECNVQVWIEWPDEEIDDSLLETLDLF